MNFDIIISKNKRNLFHKSHGGEIYKLNPNYNSLIDFSTNINPLAAPDIFNKTFINSLNQITRYPDSNSIKLREELVKYFERKITLENLIVGSGSMELIALFCELIINPGDDIIISQPSFSEYSWAVQKSGGNIINVYRKPENDFRIEVEPIINQITPKSKLIFLCNPNNPNGLLDNSEDIEKIINVASLNNVLVFLDEAFIEFAGEHNSFVSKISSFDNLFICRSFTKFFGLTGLRVGFGVSSPQIIDFVKRCQILWSVNCFGQIIAQEILKSRDFIEETLIFFSKEREFMEKELKNINGLKIFPTNTNYILINTESSGINSIKIKEELLKKRILIRDCSNYDGLNNHYIRISIKSRELNQKLINSLKEVFQS